MAESAEQRLALIKENLAEVLNEEIIKKVLDEGGHPKIYWGELESHTHTYPQHSRILHTHRFCY